MAAARILVVENDRNARSALAEILRDEGFLVETAAAGREAAAKLRQFVPHLLLGDVTLPELDGLALRALAAAEPHPPAVILMTARAGQATSSTASELLRKPLELPLLLSAVKRALAGAGRDAAPASGG
jgi:CheY-like chemotaxis protein